MLSWRWNRAQPHERGGLWPSCHSAHPRGDTLFPPTTTGHPSVHGVLHIAASAGEHHISHYLEMYFVKQGLHVPLHGLKVGMGTMVCAYLYRALERDGVTFKNSDKVYEAAKYIPELSVIKQTLEKLDVPTRFSKLNISKELFEETMLNAYTVRKRYSILRLVHDLGLAEKYLPELVEQFY